MSSPTNKQNELSSRGGGLASALVLVACAIGLGLVALNSRSIYDWVRLRGYDPPAEIVKLADQDGMKDYTRHMFYLNKPQLLPSVAKFRKDCPEDESNIVLGCYHPGQNGIYLYDVKDAGLSGVQQVTAAHEVLHAVYARLSVKERKDLDRQLQDFYEHGLSDQRVKDEISLYKKTEPNDVFDEMSCTFGTELGKLPAGLESYYGRYFKDRQVIVAYERRYQGEFTKRQALIKRYDAQLAGMKSRIDAAESDLSSKQSAINAREAQLNAYKDSGDVRAYNAGVPAYNSMIDEYNSEISSTKALVNQYNQLVDTRNKVAEELAGLAKALDTRQTPSPAH